MTNFDLEKFFKEAKNIKLTTEEKSGILRSIVRNPLPIGRNMWSINNFKLIFTKPMPIAIIIAILIGGGVSAAAEQSLPGETLFPLKVSVNEKVRGFLAVSGEAEANLQIKLAERRLEEAEKLVSNNNLNEKARIHLEENFQKHAEKVKTKIAELETKNTPKALEITSHLETSLEAHSRILTNLQTSLNGDLGVKLEKIKLMIETHRGKMNEDRVDHEEKLRINHRGPEVQTAAEGKLGAVENKMAEVRKFMEHYNDRFDAEAKVKAEAKLKLAEDILVQGKTKLEAKVFEEAFLLFQRAHNILTEVKILFSAKVDLETTPTPSPTHTISPTGSPHPSASINAETETELEARSNPRERKSEIHGKIRIDLGL